jgi:hypothetical protein
MFGSKGDEVAGENCVMRSSIVCALLLLHVVSTVMGRLLQRSLQLFVCPFLHFLPDYMVLQPRRQPSLY